MESKTLCCTRSEELKICVIIPVYNHASTLGAVVEAVKHYCSHIIVVNDGSTDQTPELIQNYGNTVQSISYFPNRGKGYALKKGFQKAISQGFHYAITLDADGQHDAADIEHFVCQIAQYPQALLIGSRRFDHPNMPKSNTFANRFSNFWVMVQTGYRLPDTQTGYRSYPLNQIKNINLITTRYESEIELLVRLAWRGITLKPISVHTFYAPKSERISHFRPGWDFVRISLLNTFLCLAAVVYGYPSTLVHVMIKKYHQTNE